MRTSRSAQENTCPGDSVTGPSFPLGLRLAGAGVHLVTALRLGPGVLDRHRGLRGERGHGAVVGLATLWIDGSDGILARRFGVKETIRGSTARGWTTSSTTYVRVRPDHPALGERPPAARLPRLGRRRGTAVRVLLPVLPGRREDRRPLLPRLPELLERRRFLRVVLDIGRPGRDDRGRRPARPGVRAGAVRLPVADRLLAPSTSPWPASGWSPTALLLARCPNPNPISGPSASSVYYIGLSLYLTVGGRAPLTPGRRAPQFQVGHQIGGVLDAAGKHGTKPGSTAWPAHCARRWRSCCARRRSWSPRPTGRVQGQQCRNGLLVGQDGGDHAVGQQHLPGRERERAGPPGPGPADAGHRRVPRSTSTTAAALAACRARRRSGSVGDRWASQACIEGRARRLPRGAPARAAGRPARRRRCYVAEHDVVVACERLGVAGQGEVGAELQRALAERGGGGVVDGDERARAWRGGGERGDVADVESRGWRGSPAARGPPPRGRARVRRWATSRTSWSSRASARIT